MLKHSPYVNEIWLYAISKSTNNITTYLIDVNPRWSRSNAGEVVTSPITSHISIRNQASGSKLNHILNVSYFVLMVSSYEEEIPELLPKEEIKARNWKSRKAKISLNRRQILFEECLLNNSSLVGQYDREILLLGGIRDRCCLSSRRLSVPPVDVQQWVIFISKTREWGWETSIASRTTCLLDSHPDN